MSYVPPIALWPKRRLSDDLSCSTPDLRPVPPLHRDPIFWIIVSPFLFVPVCLIALAFLLLAHHG